MLLCFFTYFKHYIIFNQTASHFKHTEGTVHTCASKYQSNLPAETSFAWLLLPFVSGHFSDHNVSYQVLELPYKGEEFSLALILPAEDVPIEEVENLITVELIKDWFAEMEEDDEVEISLPRCVMNSSVLCAFSLSLLILNPGSGRAGELRH